MTVYAGARAAAWQAGAGAATGVPPAERPLAALNALGHYAMMLFDPLRPRVLIGVLGEASPLLFEVPSAPQQPAPGPGGLTRTPGPIRPPTQPTPTPTPEPPRP